MPTPEHIWNLVVVDDDPADVELLHRQLTSISEFTFKLRHLSYVRTAVGEIEKLSPDLVFIDFYLGACTGLELVQAVRASNDIVPIVMLTGQGNESVVSQSLRAGADDYVSKAASSSDALRRAMLHAQAQSAHRRAEAKWRLLEYSIDHASEPVYWADEDGHFTYMNNAACRMFGYEHAELMSRSVYDVVPVETNDSWRTTFRRLTCDGSLMQEQLYRRKDGILFPVEVNVSFVRFQGSKQVCTFVRDISERKRAEKKLRDKEEQIRHKQRLEVIGALAGGVAHEFNNLLQVIRGYTSYAMEELPADGRPYQDLQNAVEATERAVSITRKLLNFSRSHAMNHGDSSAADEPEPGRQPAEVNLNETAAEVVAMLRPLIGSRIELHLEPADDLGRIAADSTLLQQMLMNLCVNARDAMPDGGALRIQTSNELLDEKFCEAHPEAKPGRFIQICVSDTGCGMMPTVMERMFDPFFTTKDVGEGTGLGLSMVHGVVQQCGGFLQVESEVGVGSKFRLYFPAIDSHTTPGTPNPRASTNHAVSRSAQRTIESLATAPSLSTDGACALCRTPKCD